METYSRIGLIKPYGFRVTQIVHEFHNYSQRGQNYTRIRVEKTGGNPLQDYLHFT